MSRTQYIDTAFRNEVQYLKDNKYNTYSNTHGIDHLPHAIKVLSLSQRGQKYKQAHNLTTIDVQDIIANQINLAKDINIHEHKDNTGTIHSHIYHLGLPNRTINALTNRGFYSIKSVLELTYTQAIRIRGISEAYIQNLIQCIKDWADKADVDITNYPLIQTMADPELWSIGPDEIRPYLNYPFEHILNHNKALSVATLDVTNGVIKALTQANINTLDDLVRIPIQQWIGIKGLGRKTVMTLVLNLIDIDKRIAQSKKYTATVNMQLNMTIEGLNKDEIYEKTIKHLHQLLDEGEIGITINEKS